jgi:hypothetical protein
MTSPTIRAALKKAADAMQGATDPNGCVPPSPQDRAAAAITAFLRALPDGVVLALLSAEQDKHRGWRDTLASAVDEAARDA